MLIRGKPLKDELPQVSILPLVSLKGNVKKPDAGIGDNDQHQSGKDQAETGEEAISGCMILTTKAF
jgi:hypothetical protein